ncbi:MAG: hypothetical protein M1837_007277 [Sclerophora amabilis]|nr:MAG: hypothetical protein M1837_007277 [Sclerophora amabilis]
MSLLRVAKLRTAPPRSFIPARPGTRWGPPRTERTFASDSTPPNSQPKPQFYLENGIGLFAKRASRPFPPPFLSPPSGSYSDPLSTHNRSRDRRPSVHGEFLRGFTNGDDAVLENEVFVGANDGVGAWAERPRGHAALWSRLILHFWLIDIEKQLTSDAEPDPVESLQRAYDQTKAATSAPTEWNGTTTACGALLHQLDGSSQPTLYVTNLGDSKVLVLRPREEKIIFRTTEQWHWFDCPRQLGTNSPDTPREHAVLDKIPLEEGDVVLAMSDGVIDNLWEHEVLENVLGSLGKVGSNTGPTKSKKSGVTSATGMDFVAKELVWAARVIAQDPFAESPFMERAVEEGLAMEGGKLDDISVVAALCKRRTG